MKEYFGNNDDAQNRLVELQKEGYKPLKYVVIRYDK